MHYQTTLRTKYLYLIWSDCNKIKIKSSKKYIFYRNVSLDMDVMYSYNNDEQDKQLP